MSMAVRKLSATVPHSCSTCSASTDVPVEITIDRGAISIASRNQDRNPPIRSRLSDLGKTSGSEDVVSSGHGSRQSQSDIPRSIGINIPGTQSFAMDLAVRQPSNSFEQPWEPAYGGASTYTFSGTHSTFARRRMSMNQGDKTVLIKPVLTPISSGTSSPAPGSESFPCRFDTCQHSGKGAFERKDQLVNHMLKAHGRRE